MGVLKKQIDSASWLRLAVWFALLFAFSSWAFGMDSPWTRALEAGQGALPETQAGIPPIEPQRSLALLEGSTFDYLLWQALDIPYAIMNLMVASVAMGLGLKALGLGASPFRFLLALPVIYVGAELVENAMVASFASGLIAPSEPFVLVQQFATTVKFATGMPALGIGAIGVVIAAIAALINHLRKPA
ncbi:MAG: hypothetical protein AAFX54_16030 [Pseudomonadota bacterium]